MLKFLSILWFLLYVGHGNAGQVLTREKLSEVAIMANDFLMQEYLGDLYYFADSPNIKRALTWYELAASRSAYAASQASKIYRLGEGGILDCGKAIRYSKQEQALSRGVIDSDWVVNMSAWVYATCADTTFRDGELALKLLKKRFDFSPGSSVPAYILDTLAAAYAAKGDFDAAVEYQRRVIDIANEDQENADEYLSHMQAYQQKKPWVDSHVVFIERELNSKRSEAERQIMLLRKKRKVAESYFGEANAEVVDIYMRLAKLYLDQKNYYLAATYASRARANGVSASELKKAGIKLRH